MSSVEIDSAAFEKDLNNYLENLLPNGIENGLKAACLLALTASDLVFPDHLFA